LLDLFNPAVYARSLSALPQLLTGAMLLVLTLLVAVRQRSLFSGRLFALTTGAASLWLIFSGLAMSTSSTGAALWWSRIAIAVAALLPAATYHFTVSLLRHEQRWILTRFAWLGSLFFFGVSVGTDLIIQTVRAHRWGLYGLDGPMFGFFILFFIVMALLNLNEYRLELARTVLPKRHEKLARLLVGFALAYGAAFDALPLSGAPLYPIGFLFVIAFLIYGARSIREYRLTAIDPSFAANEIVNTMADALFVCDSEGKIRVVNHAITSVFGYLPQELIGHSLTRFIADPDATLINATRLRKALTSGTLRDQERVFRAKDGSDIDVSISISPLKRGDAQVGSVIAARDIRERKVAEGEIKRTASLLQSTLESTADGIVVVNTAGEVVAFNQRFLRLFRLNQKTVEHAREDVLIEHMAADTSRPDMFIDGILNLRQRSEAESLDLIEFDDGRCFERYSKPQKIDDATVGRVWTYRDVTERRHAEAGLRASERRYRSLFERNLAGVYRNTLDGTIIDCNQAFARIFGYDSAAELVSRNVSDLYFNSAERDAIVEMLREVRNISSLELCLKRKDGGRVWVLENMSLVDPGDGDPPVMEGTLVDISGLKLAEEQMEFQAYHDVLTCLPNRKLFIDRLTLALAQSRRTGMPLAVMFIDLDHFKVINDTLGHTAGDELLLSVAERLSRCIREGDTVARLGGDEFTLLIANLHDPDDAAKIAEQVLEAVEEPMIIGERQLFITASIGIALSPADGVDAENLLKNADSALYRAKESGRNNYQLCTDDMKVRALERLSLENSLRRALERGELTLHYQPVIHLSSARVSGMEALIRWQHPDRGITYPDSFIPLAESSRLIVPIGDWVLRQACGQAKQWQDSGLNDFRVSVNLSPRQFQQRDLIHTVRTTLEETGLDPESLELEITESTAMQNIELTIETLRELKNMGIAISIDDFGIGYSSLNYLKRFPIDTVKIDKSFVRDLETDASDAAIVTAVIGIARILNLRVIAEGVENEHQLSFLQRKQCEEMQGFLFSRPLAAFEAGEYAQRTLILPGSARLIAN
jgi:diguanylate cyclase (GGDEF)-like protein/PAS domain S-box-containing protein